MTQKQPVQHTATRDTLWNTLVTFALTRIVIASVLQIYLIFNLNKIGGQENIPLPYWQIGLVYLLLAGVFVFFAYYHRRHFMLQLGAQIALDLIAISILYVAAGGNKTGLAILYLFPLAGAAILMRMLLALFFAALVTIFLLGESVYRMLVMSSELEITQAGLYGATFFSAVLVINRLAARLIREEALAVQRGIDLQVQEAINRLVIADMNDGILVVDSQGTVLTANPAAERMLGLVLAQRRTRLTEIALLKPIEESFTAWRALPGVTTRGNVAMPVFVVIKPGDDLSLQASITLQGARRELAIHLKLRFVPVELAGQVGERTVIFLQDVTEIENQAQQLKLASMGRLTASIAHEVRNPLAAISHASSLLAEESINPMQARLLHIVSDNVERLNRMIEDILKLSRKAQLHDEPLILGPFLTKVLQEFEASHELAPGLVELGEMDDYYIWFDPLHLHEVIINLLSNAIRYASGKPGSVRIYAVIDVAQRLELHVQDDGPPITPTVRAHLFEPFYTTSSKGTGLGLYLTRELCLNNGAIIDYEYRTDYIKNSAMESGGRFVITFAAAMPV